MSKSLVIGKSIGRMPGDERMDSVTSSDDRPREPFPVFQVQRMIAASAVRHPGHVIIVGTQQIDLLVALMHLGFSNVDCLSPSFGPHPPREAADVLIAPTVSSEAGLRSILHRFRSALRPRGVFVMREAIPRAGGAERRLRQILFEAGFAAIERVPTHNPSRQLWCARKLDAAMAKAA